MKIRLPSQTSADHARIVRFLIVGGTATAVYFGLAMAASGAGLPVEIAHLIAFAVSIIVSYFGQKLFTFRVQGEHARNIARFALATAGISALQFLLVAGLNAMRVDKVLIFLASSAFYPAASFLVHSYWTFRQPGREASSVATPPLTKP